MQEPSATSLDLVEQNRRLRQRIAELESALTRSEAREALPRVEDLMQLADFSGVLGSTLNLQRSLEKIANLMLEVFGCDRAWMLHPCDPASDHWRVPVEVSHPAWPSALPVDCDLPMQPGHRQILAEVLASEGPVVMHSEACRALDPDLLEVHSIQSQVLVRILPERGEPWVLGMHQCSHDRQWTPAELQLLQFVAGRVAQVLSCLLAHREVEEREERLKLALDSVQDGVWDLDLVSDELVFSDSMALMLGYAPDELEPRADCWRDLVHPEDVVRVVQAKADYFEGRSETYSCEARLRTKSGDWTWILDRGKVVSYAPDGTPLRATGTHKNIDASKRTELMLERERRLFTGGPCIVFRWAAADGWPVEYVSPNVSQLFGHCAEDFTSGRVPYVNVIHPDDLERVAEEVTRHSNSGAASFEQEYRILRAGGEVRWLYDFTVIDRNSSGEITHFEGYVLDLTDRKQAEAKRAELEAQVQQSQKLESLGVLAGGIAHDFNNLLMGVLGHSDLALSTVDAQSEAAQHLQGIMRASKQAAELTEQMLAYSGKGRFQLARTNVNQVVEEMMRLLQVTVSKTAELRLNLFRNLPPITADGSQLRQVIMNLISNAAEAVGDSTGSITIATRTVHFDAEELSRAFKAPELPAGEYVCIEVLDSGSGMDEATQRKMFDPFFTTKFTGRGLGMAAVQGIVRGHAGAIRVESAPDQGTTIQVILPATPGKLPLPVGAGEGEEWSASGTVLLVDDEESVRAIGELMLQALGLQVELAETGARAIEIMQTRAAEIDCVILDLTMPKLSGLETFELLQDIDPCVRVVLSSGYSQDGILERFAGSGLVGFIQKPYGREALAKVLRKVF